LWATRSRPVARRCLPSSFPQVGLVAPSRAANGADTPRAEAAPDDSLRLDDAERRHIIAVLRQTRGVIEGFHAHVVPEALGLDLLAFVFVGWSNPATEAPFLARVAAAPAVLECHHVTGSWNYLLKVRLPNTRDLERFLGQVVKEVQGVERTETIIALSSAKETTTLISDPLGQQS